VHPGRKFGATLELVEILEAGEQGILQNVFGVFSTPR
jgi:hypothetical protein